MVPLIRLASTSYPGFMRIQPFSLERHFARHEFSARRLLGSSDPEALSVAELRALEPGAAERLGDHCSFR